MQHALAAQRRGSIAEAKRLYALLLSIDPANAAAYGNLAIIAAERAILQRPNACFARRSGCGPNSSGRPQ